MEVKTRDRIILAVCIIAIIITSPIWLPNVMGGSKQNQQDQALSDKYSSMSLQEIRSNAVQIVDMSALERNPDRNIGKLIRFDAKIVQVEQSGDDYILRVSSVDPQTMGYTGQDVWINYKLGSNSGRPLEGDKIDVCGLFTGLKTYTTVLGSSKTIPEVTAYYI